MVEIAPELLPALMAVELDGPIDTSRWNGEGVPSGVVLQWVEKLPICSTTVALLEAVDPRELAPTDHPLYIKQWDRLESHAAAAKLKAIRLLAGPDGSHKGWDDQDPAPQETSLALRVPLAQANAEVNRARRLASHLPRTLQLHDAGILTTAHVRKIVTATQGLGKDKCAQVEERALRDVDNVNVRDFARKVRRAVNTVHPRPLNDRHAEAAANSDVSVWPAEDAMGCIAATMPLLDAMTVKAAVDSYAMTKKTAGDLRPLGMLRAEGLRFMCERYLTGEITGSRPTVHGRPVEIQVVATPQALLGITDTPAEIPGVGEIPVEMIRAMAHEAKFRWMTISETGGHLIDQAPTVYRIGVQLHRFIDAKYVTSVGPHSTSPATGCDGEHLVPYGEGGLTDSGNTAPMDRKWHNGKTHGGFLVDRQPNGSITWTTPLGQTYTVDPYDYRLGP